MTQGPTRGIPLDTDGTLAADSDQLVATQKATKTYVDTNDALKQPLDADLTAIANLVSAADKMPYSTAAQTWALAALTSFARTVLDDTTAPAALTTLGANRTRKSLSPVTNVIAESFDRGLIGLHAGYLSSGRLHLVGIQALAGDVITNVSFFQGSSAFTGATNGWFALIDSSLNVIRQSTDQLTAGITANTVKTLAVDSVPVTAGARAGSTTVTLTFPTLSQSLATLFTAGDSIVVSNANIAAYNGTFTIVSVGASTITYVSGGSATDSLSAPFPTVQPAAGKRTYTVPADAVVYAAIMLTGTVGYGLCYTTVAAATAAVPISNGIGNTSLTGTCPSPCTLSGVAIYVPYAAVS